MNILIRQFSPNPLHFSAVPRRSATSVRSLEWSDTSKSVISSPIAQLTMERISWFHNLLFLWVKENLVQSRIRNNRFWAGMKDKHLECRQ